MLLWPALGLWSCWVAPRPARETRKSVEEMEEAFAASDPRAMSINPQGWDKKFYLGQLNVRTGDAEAARAALLERERAKRQRIAEFGARRDKKLKDKRRAGRDAPPSVAAQCLSPPNLCRGPISVAAQSLSRPNLCRGPLSVAAHSLSRPNLGRRPVLPSVFFLVLTGVHCPSQPPTHLPICAPTPSISPDSPSSGKQ